MADQRANDKKIKETLLKYGEDLTGSVWRVQGTAVIYHKTLERIAVKAKIWFTEPKVIRAERDEAVLQITGYMGGKMMEGSPQGFERMEWSIGEALIGVNYRVSGKQAAYVYAMAEKRAKDRVILKLIELSGMVYSEEEADEFKKAGTRGEQIEDTVEHDEDGVVDPNPPPSDTSAVRGSTPAGKEAYSGAARAGQKPEDSVAAKVRANIDRRDTWQKILEFMLAPNTVDALKARMTEEEAQEIRLHASNRMRELGWPGPEDKPKDVPSSRELPPEEERYSKYNLQSLPTRISTAIADAKTVQEMESLLDGVLLEQGLEWSKLPEDVQKKIDGVADKKVAFLKKNAK